jgi:sugar phosphate isomerase/epimerase
MKLATTTGDYGRYTNSQIEAMERIRSAGFSFCDYSFGVDYNKKSGIYGVDFKAYLDEVNRAQESLELKLVQAHAPMGDPLDDPDGSFLRDTMLCVDACGAWGIKNLVVHSGYLRGISKEETFLRNRDFYLPLLKRAEKYGVNILVENFNKMCIDGLYWIDNATDLLAMIECVNHPLFHAVWDVGHANMQEMPQDDELRILGSHVRALHIQDNMGDDDNHLCPFLGTLNLDDVMHGLFAIGYNGYFTFEVGRFFTLGERRRKFDGDHRRLEPTIELRDLFESYLYSLGKYVLEKYGCFEE